MISLLISPMKKLLFLCAAFLLACMFSFGAGVAFCKESPEGVQTLEQAANDPTASLMSVQIQNVYADNYHNLDDEDGNTILLRSAIPFKTGPLNHIARSNQLLMGIFTQNLSSFAGDDDREDVNLSIIQPILNYSLAISGRSVSLR